jgi:hypothetical protein
MRSPDNSNLVLSFVPNFGTVVSSTLGKTGSSPFTSEVPGNSCSSSDASPETRNSSEENEEMGTPARPVRL